MITLRRENRIVRVTENELEKYLSKGYKQVSVESQEAPRKPEIKAETKVEAVEEKKEDTPKVVTQQTRTRRKK